MTRASFPDLKERFMLKLRFARVLYFMGVVTMFVVAAGADRKFCK